jgi:beta-phosphoglucomutase-like phosphatase (HAD superfamily)/dTDP-glucose pyrophosphorylase
MAYAKMNKLIIFDLDGVLVDSKDLHFIALNLSLEVINKEYVISLEDQKNIYEGLPTNEKLKILTARKGLDPKFYAQIWDEKQRITADMFKDMYEDAELIKHLTYVKDKGIKVAIASNSIFATIEICMEKLGIAHLIDYAVSNEDVLNKKPHPEMYWKAMAHLEAVPDCTVIFEDSFIGKIAVKESKTKLIAVKNRSDLTFEKILEATEYLENSSTWEEDTLNVIIPMAGAGSRFLEAGYVFPKPLVDVNEKPMIQAVVENLSLKAKYTYIVREEHVKKYNLIETLNVITPGCNVAVIDAITEGAASTLLLAKNFIDNNRPLIIANSDQIVNWDSREFIYDLYTKNADGGIAVFTSSHPKWSYAKIDETGRVVEVAEKKAISNLATVGIYYWKRGSDFVKYAEQMILKNIRVNNEFYTCPVFNEAIADGKQIYTYAVDKMWGVGTPEDLEAYLRANHAQDCT